MEQEKSEKIDDNVFFDYHFQLDCLPTNEYHYDEFNASFGPSCEAHSLLLAPARSLLGPALCKAQLVTHCSQLI